MIIKDATEANWDELTKKSDKPVISMFYMVSCPACEKMKPQFEALAEKFGDDVNFIRIEAMNNLPITNKYGILAAPAFKFFSNGKLDESIDVDLLRGEDFDEAVSDWINKIV